jgi:hypothetical protein
MSKKHPLVYIALRPVTCVRGSDVEIEGREAGKAWFHLAAMRVSRVNRRAGRRNSLSDDAAKIKRAERLLRHLDGL